MHDKGGRKDRHEEVESASGVMETEERKEKESGGSSGEACPSDAIFIGG